MRLPLSLPLSHPSLNLARAVPPHPPHPTTSLPSLPPSSAAEPTIHLHSLPSFSLHRTFSSHTGGVSDVAFSADSTLLASASDDTTVRVWEVDPALPLAHRPQHPDETPDNTAKVEHAARVLQGHLTAVFCVAWSPRGDLVASGGVDETVRVWDVQKGALRSLFLLLLRSELTETGPTGRCMRVLPAHSEPVSAVQFSRDGTMLVSCSWDGYMCVSPSPLASPSRPPLTPGSPPLLRPSRIWDTSTGQCLKTLAHEDNTPVASCRFSPNSKLLFTATLDSSIRLWDYQNDKVVKSYAGHANRKCVPPLSLSLSGASPRRYPPGKGLSSTTPSPATGTAPRRS